MTDDTANLVLEHLRAIRTDIARINIVGIRSEMVLMEQHMAAFTTRELTQDSEIASLKARVIASNAVST